MPNPNRVVEAVARGIYEGRNGVGCTPWSRLPKSHQEPYLKDAKAAGKAFAENIDDGMMEAGAETYHRMADCVSSDDAMRFALKAALLAAAGEVEGG